MASAVFRVQFAQGSRQPGRQMGRVARELRPIMLDEFRSFVEPQLEATFAAHAPYDYDERDDTHLRDELEVRIAVAGRIKATVHSPVRDPRTGFPYTDVTRFGRGPIEPHGGNRFLKFPYHGRTVYARRVGPWSPGSDWVEDARPEAESVAGDAADRVGRVVYTRLL